MKHVRFGARLRRRFWGQVGVASLSGGLAVVMARVPNWIEIVLGRRPDGGDGSAEGLIAIALIGFSALLFLLAVVEAARGGRAVRATATLPSRRE